MRYLDKRADFLSQRQHIKTSEVESIYEAQSGAGPFANDVGWNDSLLGRLINHMIRKARIAAKVPRIKNLIERLNAAFEELVGQSTVFKTSSETQTIAMQAQVASFYYELINAVEAGEPVSLLKKLTDEAIQKTKDLPDFDKKEILLEELKKFREFLDQFKDGEESTTGEDNSNDNVSQYGIMVKNLQALALILANYKKVNLGVTTQSKIPTLQKDKEYMLDDNIVKLVDPKIVGTKVTVIYKDKATKTYKPNAKPVVVPAAKLKEITNEANVPAPIRSNTYGNVGGSNIDRNNVTGTENHLTQAFSKLKKDIEVLISAKEKGIAVDYNFINNILSNSKNTKSKDIIKSLYTEINRYLVGDKKGTIQEKDALYKESIDILSDKNKLTIVAEKIARFSKRAVQFDGENMYGGLGDFGANLKSFVDTIKQIKSFKLGNVSESILSYSLFLEQATTLDGDSKRILDFFNETCIEVRKFTLSKEDLEKARKEYEEKSSDDKEVIMSMDPIIEIMNLFIKSYKLYTVKTITKRSENVDTNTLSEYTPLGSADDSGRKGPYRNNKLFDMWEEAVNSIRKNRKYQVFFTDQASLRLPSVPDPNPYNSEDWKVRPKAGRQFSKFINDVMDGDKLYKSSDSRGSVARFLDEYFGDGSTTKEQQGRIDNAGLQDNAQMEEQISNNAINLKMIKSDKTDGNYVNTFFTITFDKLDKDGKEAGKGQYSFYVSDSETNLMFSTGIKEFRNMLTSIGPKRNIDKGEMDNLSNNLSDKYFTRVKDIRDIFTGNTLDLGYVADGKTSILRSQKVKVTGLYRLVYDKEPGKLYRLEGDDLTKWNAILRSKNIPSVKSMVDVKNPEIKKV
jgi:hypothetical protein